MSELSISVAQILNLVHEKIDRQEFSGTTAILDLVLSIYPEQPDTLHAYGVTLLNQGDGATAKNYLEKAVRSLDRLPEHELYKQPKAMFLAHLGRAEQLLGNYAFALVAFKRSLMHTQNEAVAKWYKELDNETQLIGQKVEKLIEIYEKKELSFSNKSKSSDLTKKKSSKDKIKNEEAISSVQSLVKSGGIEKARDIEPLCKYLVENYPKNGNAHHWMAICFLYQRKNEDALSSIEKAVSLEPWHPYFLNTKAIIQRRLNLMTEAAQTYEALLRNKPDYAEAHQNLANIYRDEGDYEVAESWYLRTLEIKKEYPECLNNLGILYAARKEYKKAIEFYKLAAESRPDYPNPHLNLGVVYEQLRDRYNAVNHFRKALQINPMLHEAWLSLMHSQMHLCDWNGLQEGINTVKRLVNESYPGELLPFNFLALPGTTGEEQKKCAELFVKSRYSQFVKQADAMNWAYIKKKNEKLRIGYLSADFRGHAVGVSFVEVLEKHDKDKFDVFAYGYGENDGTEVRKRIEASTIFIDISNYRYLDAAKKIYEDKIDILVDLTAYTSNGRSEIMALRPAPIQVNYLGYPSTMGAEFIDYIIGDKVITPLENKHHFREALALLPNCYFPNDRRRQVTENSTREEEGLPLDKFVFCSFNQPYKINPPLWDIWCSILREVPNSVLWLHAFEDHAKQNLRARAEDLGIDGTRLMFARVKKNLSDHLGRLSLADLALDTFPYNGHTTTADALWAGLPVLTLIGNTFASRVAASILNAAMIPELVTKTTEDYRDSAVDLACNKHKLEVIKNRIKANRNGCPLFDSTMTARNLEKIYSEMNRCWIAGKKPEDIIIQ